VASGEYAQANPSVRNDGVGFSV